MERKTQRAVLAAVAGLLATGMAGFSVAQAHGEGEAEGDVHCYGINKCKGAGDCGGKGHSCHGMNECKGQAFISLSEDDCLRIEGGRLTEAAEAPAESES